CGVGVARGDRLLRDTHQVHRTPSDLERHVGGVLERVLERVGADVLLLHRLLRQLVRGHHVAIGGSVAVGQAQEDMPFLVALLGHGCHPAGHLFEPLLLERQTGHHRDQRRAGRRRDAGPRPSAGGRRIGPELVEEPLDPLASERNVHRDRGLWHRNALPGGPADRRAFRRGPFGHVAHPAPSICRSSTWRSASNPRRRTWAMSPSPSAASGTRPTISESVIRSPRASASRATASNASTIPVTAWSARLIDTVTHPRSGTRNPIARSAGSPPPEVLTVRAIARAAS